MVDANILTYDYGYVAGGVGFGTLSLGNQVFYDSNGDGIYDPDGADDVAGNADDEYPIEGVVVELWQDTNGDGIYETYIASTTTNDQGDGVPIFGTGNYLFENLPEGDYEVRIVDSNFDPGGALEGLNLTEGPDQSGDPLLSDNHSKVEPYQITLTTDNLTVDYGYVSPPAGLGDYVWEDNNNDGQQGRCCAGAWSGRCDGQPVGRPGR